MHAYWCCMMSRHRNSGPITLNTRREIIALLLLVVWYTVYLDNRGQWRRGTYCCVCNVLGCLSVRVSFWACLSLESQKTEICSVCINSLPHLYIRTEHCHSIRGNGELVKSDEPESCGRAFAIIDAASLDDLQRRGFLRK